MAKENTRQAIVALLIAILKYNNQFSFAEAKALNDSRGWIVNLKGISIPKEGRHLSEVDLKEAWNLAQISFLEESRRPPNLAIVWSGKVYRSGLPRTEEHWQWFKTNKIRGILNFCVNTDHTLAQREVAGVTHYLNLKVPDSTFPTEEQIERAFAFVNDPLAQPVLFHCRHGQGRTGSFAALLRIKYDSWSVERALKEARSFGGLSWEQEEWLREDGERYKDSE